MLMLLACRTVTILAVSQLATVFHFILQMQAKSYYETSLCSSDLVYMLNLHGFPFCSGSPCSGTCFKKVNQEAMSMSICWQELKCLMDTKAGTPKAASRHSLADWLHDHTRLVWHGIGRMFEQLRKKGCSIRLKDGMLCRTMYLDKDCFFTLKNKLHLPTFLMFCPFLSSFFY